MVNNRHVVPFSHRSPTCLRCSCSSISIAATRRSASVRKIVARCVSEQTVWALLCCQAEFTVWSNRSTGQVNPLTLTVKRLEAGGEEKMLLPPLNCCRHTVATSSICRTNPTDCPQWQKIVSVKLAITTEW